MAEIALRVQPRSSQNKVQVEADGLLRVWVTAPPTDGQANAAVCELLAKKLGISKTCVRVVRGQTSRQKVLEVSGLSEEELTDRLRAMD